MTEKKQLTQEEIDAAFAIVAAHQEAQRKDQEEAQRAEQEAFAGKVAAARELLASPEYELVKSGLRRIALDFIGYGDVAYPYQMLGRMEQFFQAQP